MSGNVTINIIDGGGTVVVPAASVQLVLGCSSAGTVGQINAATQPNQLTTALGYGPLVEAAALACLAGGTVLAIKVAQNAAGTAEAVTFTGTGSSVITVTLDGTVGAFDDYYIVFKCVVGGTKGTTGITFQISLDAGRSFGPVLALGIASTYAIPNTGVTLNFAAGTLFAGDVAKFATVGPSFNTAGIQSALNVFAASQYAIAGIGTIHVVGGTSSTAGTQAGCAGADATSIEGYLDTLVTGAIFNHVILSARDAHQPTAFGGAGETEATWLAAIESDFLGVSAKRICSCGGYYNMPSAFPNTAAGAPRYRRPGAWALAAREIAIPPQRHAGRVKDGSLTQIVTDPSNDPSDGFVYHDERNTPSLTSARFAAFKTRIKQSGYFVDQPNLMSPPGSDYDILPKGLVMDVACAIVFAQAEQLVNDDVRLQPTGVLYENDARTIERGLKGALDSTMTATSEISSSIVVVNRAWNVQVNNSVQATITIVARGYVLSVTLNIGFSNSSAAT